MQQRDASCPAGWREREAESCKFISVCNQEHADTLIRADSGQEPFISLKCRSRMTPKSPPASWMRWLGSAWEPRRGTPRERRGRGDSRMRVRSPVGCVPARGGAGKRRALGRVPHVTAKVGAGGGGSSPRSSPARHVAVRAPSPSLPARRGAKLPARPAGEEAGKVSSAGRVSSRGAGRGQQLVALPPPGPRPSPRSRPPSAPARPAWQSAGVRRSPPRYCRGAEAARLAACPR